MNDGNSNIACTDRNTCDWYCGLETFQIRSMDSPHCPPSCAHTHWIGLLNRIVFSDHINYHCNKENKSFTITIQNHTPF